jgi:hypothetical protein
MDNLLLLYSADNSPADYYSFLYDSFLKFLLQNINNKTIFLQSGVSLLFSYSYIVPLYPLFLPFLFLLSVLPFFCATYNHCLFSSANMYFWRNLGLVEKPAFVCFERTAAWDGFLLIWSCIVCDLWSEFFWFWSNNGESSTPRIDDTESRGVDVSVYRLVGESTTPRIGESGSRQLCVSVTRWFYCTIGKIISLDLHVCLFPCPSCCWCLWCCWCSTTCVRCSSPLYYLCPLFLPSLLPVSAVPPLSTTCVRCSSPLYYLCPLFLPPAQLSSLPYPLIPGSALQTRVKCGKY